LDKIKHIKLLRNFIYCGYAALPLINSTWLSGKPNYHSFYHEDHEGHEDGTAHFPYLAFMLFILLSINFLFFMYDFEPTNFDATRITLKFFAFFACFVVIGFWLRLRRARCFME